MILSSMNEQIKKMAYNRSYKYFENFDYSFAFSKNPPKIYYICYVCLKATQILVKLSSVLSL